MTVRSEQTLRRMWVEAETLRGKAARLAEEEQQCVADAVSAEDLAKTHRKAAAAARDTGTAMATEAADLADLVNRERVDGGLGVLKPGEPYPAATPETEPPIDMPRAGAPADAPVALADLGRVPRDGGWPTTPPPPTAPFAGPVAGGPPVDAVLGDLTRLAQDGGQQP